MITSVESMEQFRHDSELSYEQLWVRYFALGGRQSPIELKLALLGNFQFDRAQTETVAVALNERFGELDKDSPVPYPE